MEVSDRFECNFWRTVGLKTHGRSTEYFDHPNGIIGRLYLTVLPNNNSIYPVVEVFRSRRNPPKTPIFLNILSRNPKFKNKFKIETFAEGDNLVCGPKILISEVLNSENGLLDENGAMSIEYRFHMDSIYDDQQNIWKFNLPCKIFDSESKRNMITYEKGKEILYSHKRVLILFHDSQLKIYNASHPVNILKVPGNIKMKSFEKFLQIAHGVQLQLDVHELLDVVRIAHEYKIQNVSKYCDRQLLIKIPRFSEEDFRIFFPKKSRLGAISKLIMDAAKFNLNHFLAFLLEIKNPFFKRFKLEEMTNESMKMIVAKVLYGENIELFFGF